MEKAGETEGQKRQGNEKKENVEAAWKQRLPFLFTHVHRMRRFFSQTRTRSAHVVSLPRWIFLNLHSSHFKTLKWSLFHDMEVLIRERRLRRSSNVFAMQYAKNTKPRTEESNFKKIKLF